MKLVIFWEDFLHYHIARIVALCDLAKKESIEIYPIALRAKSPELPIEGYHQLLNNKIKVLSNKTNNVGGNSKSSKAQLITALDEIAPDVVAIIGYTDRVSRAALSWCRYNQKGAVLMFESQEQDYNRHFLKEWIKSRIVRLYDAAITGGINHANYVHKLGLPRQRIFFKYDTVDNHFWQKNTKITKNKREQLRKHYDLPTRFFLTAARFIPKKNLTGLIAAYAKYVEEKGPDAWRLVIVGDGALGTDLKQQVKQLNLEQLVYFPGYLSSQQMAHFYGLASTFILASSFSEQWGLVVNEAMASGLPVLVSNICGCVPELVIEGETGFSFDAKESKELTKLLCLTSSGQIDLEKMGHTAQQHIQKFAPTSFADELLKAANLAIIHAQKRPKIIWPSLLFNH
ncbi:MAG: glycosyltransferase [Saprospiraceae bacterium]